MHRPFLRQALALATTVGLTAPLSAQAESLVLPGSTYSVFFRGSQTGVSSAVVQFDGIDQGLDTVWADGRTLHFGIREQEQDLGGGRWSVDISMYAATDLFTVPDETVWVNVGVDSQPLQLQRTVKLDRAVLSFHRADDSLFDGDSWDLTATAAMPWDGYLNKGQAYGFLNVGGHGVTRATFHFEASAVPEPATVPLWLGGAVALLAWRRRVAPCR